MKVALVHDYLREYGGAERVVEVLHEMFPQAPLYTAYYNPGALGKQAQRFKGWDIRTSWLQKVPFANSLLSPFRIFAPMMFESFDLREYDLVISSASIYFAKAVITKSESLHISYIHTPPRYLYGYTTSFNYKKNPLTRAIAELMNHFLRLWDFETSQRPDVLVANSQNVRQRIKKFYRREAEVIYPPVDIEEFSSLSMSFPRMRESKKQKNNGSLVKPGMTEKGDYYLSLNRLWKGKGTDLVIKACSKLKLKLKVAGVGPELDNLKEIAGEGVKFLGSVSDEERVKLMSQAKALIVAAEDEDFGITVVEAQAAGTPVIALREGGYLETIEEGKTGEFFDEATVESLVGVLKKFDPKEYKAEDCHQNAKKFSKERFKKELLGLIEKNIKS